MQKTVNVTIKNIRVNHYVGILESEQKRKNRISIDIEYIEGRNKIADYSEVYKSAIETVFSKKWTTMELLSYEISNNILHSFPQIKRVKVRVRKSNPIKMEMCDYAEVEYDSEK